MEFKDYFSTQAEEYAKYRPKYPPELFEYLAALVNEHKTAWDSATGSGQAAQGLTGYFEKIIATDASEAQLKHAHAHKKIDYRVAVSEDSKIESDSIDLITVATAIHWINTDKFFPEVKRVAKPGAVIAIWTYADSEITNDINRIMKRYSKEIIGKHWPPENTKAWNFEEMTPFPFERIKTPDFKIENNWSLKEFLNYLYTWSATQNYIRNTGVNPLEELHDKLEKLWGGEDNHRKISWKLHIKAGRI